MPKISLKIHFPNSHDGYKMMQFDDTITVKKAIEDIHSKHNERKANLDTIKGMWQGTDFLVFQLQ